jgi:hypothetical protein
MITERDILLNLLKLKVTKDFENDVKCAFEDYEFCGEKEILVYKDESKSDIDYHACIRHHNAPIFLIKIKNDSVENVWIYRGNESANIVESVYIYDAEKRKRV